MGTSASTPVYQHKIPGASPRLVRSQYRGLSLGEASPYSSPNLLGPSTLEVPAHAAANLSAGHEPKQYVSPRHRADLSPRHRTDQYISSRYPKEQYLSPRHMPTTLSPRYIPAKFSPRHGVDNYVSPRHSFSHDDILLRRSPNKTHPTTILMQGSGGGKGPYVKKSHSDYIILEEKGGTNSFNNNLSNGSSFVMKKPEYVDDLLDEGYVMKNVSEYVLQPDGKYLLKESGNYMIRSSSALLTNKEENDHPFAPTSSNSSRESINSEKSLRYRNVKTTPNDGNTSGYADYRSKESGTGLVLTRVVRVLEATPPQFLLVPERDVPWKTVNSPTSSVGTNTLPVPPNTGHGRRPDNAYRRDLNPEDGQRRNDRANQSRRQVQHRYSSPELLKESRKSTQSERSSSASLVPIGPISPTRHRNTISSNNENQVSPRTRNYDRSTPSPTSHAVSSSLDKPPHLIPTPRIERLLTPTKTRERLKSSASMKSPHSLMTKSPIKQNIFGNVYI